MGRMLEKDDTIAVLVDYQAKLSPMIWRTEETIDHIVRAVRALRVVGVPILVSTQYAKGLGDTIPEIEEALGPYEAIDKNTFSCMDNAEFRETLEKTGKKSVILIGIESHICVQQTALALLDEGYTVYVLSDCVSSERERDYLQAIRRMEHAGVVVTTYESCLYEIMKGAKYPGFRDVQKIILGD